MSKSKPKAESGRLVTREDLISRIDKCVRVDADKRASRERIRKTIAYAVEQGHLSATADGRFDLNEVVVWARKKKKWLGKFDHVPASINAELRRAVHQSRRTGYARFPRCPWAATRRNSRHGTCHMDVPHEPHQQDRSKRTG